MPWDKPIAKLADDIEESIDDDVRDLAFYGFKRCQQVSPVDTGAFKQSWQIERDGTSWLITNPQVYGPRLDDGYSSQAPEGITSVVIADMRARP